MDTLTTEQYSGTELTGCTNESRGSRGMHAASLEVVSFLLSIPNVIYDPYRETSMWGGSTCNALSSRLIGQEFGSFRFLIHGIDFVFFHLRRDLESFFVSYFPLLFDYNLHACIALRFRLLLPYLAYRARVLHDFFFFCYVDLFFPACMISLGLLR